MAFCTNCGAEIQDGVSFCTKCGTPIADAPTTPIVTHSSATEVMESVIGGVEPDVTQSTTPDAAPPTMGEAVSLTPPQPPKRRPWVIPVVAAACALVLGVGAYAVSTAIRGTGSSDSSSVQETEQTAESDAKSSGDPIEEAVPDESVEAGGATVDNVLGAFQESGGLDFEEAKQNGEYIMLKRGEKYYSISESKVEYPEAYSWDSVLRYADKEYADIPTFDFAAGDELILFEKVGYKFWSTEDKNDCLFPYEMRLSLEEAYDEIDGQEVGDNYELVRSILASKGAYFTLYGEEIDSNFGWLHGPRGTSFHVGRYVGTSFEEDTITIDAEYWSLRDAKELDIDEIKTKDGYFILDTSHFTPGTYLGTIAPNIAADFIFRVADSSGETVNQDDSSSVEASKTAAANTATSPSFSKASASSICATDDVEPYDPYRATDGKVASAWVTDQATAGDGTGQWIELSNANLQHVQGVRIMPGFCKNAEVYAKNRRPRDITISFSDGTSQRASLADVFGEYQDIPLNTPVDTTTLRITIDSTYAPTYNGKTYDDCAISEIEVY